MARIGAVILAAGGSSRFGKPKQLVRFEGRTLVEHAIEAAVGGGCQPVVLVIGSDGSAVRTVISDATISLVENARWSEGIGTSIDAGMRRLLELAPDSEAVVLLVCDQPFVTDQIVTRLVQQWRETGKTIVASRYSDTLGVPALFAASCVEELLRLPPDSGAKPIILLHPERVATVPFPEGATDIDTLQDYDRIAAGR